MTPLGFLCKGLRFIDKVRWGIQYREYRERYEVAPTFRFNGHGIQLYGDGRIVLGAGSYIGERSQIQAVEGCRVEVGRDAALSHYVAIYTEDRAATPEGSTTEKRVRGDVSIGDRCWVGLGVFIRGGVSIGAGSIVGAHSVVTRSIPAGVVAAGAPCRVIRRL